MRTKHRLAFDPASEFMARRQFVLAGVSLNYDDPIDKSGIEERRLKNMFDARLIEIDPRTPAERAKAFERAAKARSAAEAPTPAPDAEASQAGSVGPAVAGKARVEPEPSGFGYYRIMDGAGNILKGKIKGKTKAAAELQNFL